jgi:DNA-directed RNA polymerase specialized sigma24 family protein
MAFAWHVIRDHLMQSSSTLRFQRSFETIRQTRDGLMRFQDPIAVLDRLHGGGGDRDQKNLVLSALVVAAQGDGPASDSALTLLLLALWPGMDGIRRRSIGRRLGTAEEITSNILARTTEAIRCLDLDRVNRIAATILRNVERDMIRARQRDLERESVGTDIDPDDLPDERDWPHLGVGEARWQDDLRSLIGDDAALVTRVAIEGFSQAEVAVELGLSEAATRKRYQRATRRIRERLQESV